MRARPRPARHGGQSGGRRARRKEPDRIAELHALIGAIGEQAALCWGFERDAQRFDATRNKISVEHHRLVLRALSEAGGHFLLGAAHSLGNLGLRIALLDSQASLQIQAGKPKAAADGHVIRLVYPDQNFRDRGIPQLALPRRARLVRPVRARAMQSRSLKTPGRSVRLISTVCPSSRFFLRSSRI